MAEEDVDMNVVEHLMNFGITQRTAQWVMQGGGGIDSLEELKGMWGNLRAYGKGAKQVHAHVHELYSPPRVNSMVERMRLVPGLSLDLTTVDPEDNCPWDFNVQAKRDKAERLIKGKRAVLLVVSPMCAAFSRLQNLNFPKMEPTRVKGDS